MLKRYIGRSLGATLVVLNLMLAACSAATPAVELPPTTAPAQAAPAAAAPAPTAAPTQAAPAAAPIPADVAVAEARVLRNALGQAIIAGTVVNATAAAVGGIELEITASDAAGDTLLKDSWGSEPADSAIFAPLAAALGPGEAAPFAYTIYEGEPADFAVAVSHYAPAEAIPAQPLTIERAQFVTDVLGEQHLLGEVVNVAESDLSIQSLRVAVYAADDTLLTVEDADILVRQLGPAGQPSASAPIDISLGELPGEPATYAVYAEVAPAEAAELPVTIAERFHSYVDAAGRLHLVGMIGNAGDAAVSTELTAGLYDADGVLLDRSGGGLYWLRLPAGAALPYDFSDFSLITSVPELAARLDRYTVQVDPQYTHREEAGDIAIEAAGEQLVAEGERWTVTGQARNSAEQPVGRVVVVAALLDADGNPKVVGSKILDTFEGGALAPGATAEYEISLAPDPDLSADELELAIYVYASPAQ